MENAISLGGDPGAPVRAARHLGPIPAKLTVDGMTEACGHAGGRCIEPGAQDIHDRSALFLDLDGTLVDIVARPDPIGLALESRLLLENLSRALDGALALVSGRALADVDLIVAPLVLPAAGVHGAERRDARGTIHRAQIPSLLALELRARRLAARHAGLFIERKPGAVALHYRSAPTLERLCVTSFQSMVRGSRDFEVVCGKMVVEIRARGLDKGRAIAAFLAEPPFAGRQAVFAGDDTTDEDGFVLVESMGGIGIKVGAGTTSASRRVASPRALLDQLQLVATRLGAAA